MITFVSFESVVNLIKKGHYSTPTTCIVPEQSKFVSYVSETVARNRHGKTLILAVEH